MPTLFCQMLARKGSMTMQGSMRAAIPFRAKTLAASRQANQMTRATSTAATSGGAEALKGSRGTLTGGTSGAGSTSVSVAETTLRLKGRQGNSLRSSSASRRNTMRMS